MELALIVLDFEQLCATLDMNVLWQSYSHYLAILWAIMWPIGHHLAIIKVIF